MKRTSKNRYIPTGLAALGALAFIAARAGGCGSDNNSVPVATTTNAAYEDAYLNDAYYPSDVAYSSAYWADSWDYAGLYVVYTPPTTVGGAGGSAGTAPDGSVAVADAGAGGSSGTTRAAPTSIATAIEALARGEQVCPGQVTVTEKTATPACAGGSTTQERNGVTISFNGCQLSGGGTINGTVDVQSNRSASQQTCSATTTITLGHTTTITNLSFTGTDGRKLLIPSQTDTGMTSYTFGQLPTTLHITSTGELQSFDSTGTMTSDHTYTDDNTFTLSGNVSYSVTGTSNITEKIGTATATLTKTGITRSGGCCRPTAGTLVVNRSGGLLPGQATWTFGPTCGTIMRNNVTVTLPNCL